VRGNANGDTTPAGKARLDIADPITMLGYLFGGGPKPPCLDVFDSNDDGGVNIADAIYLLSYLFAAGKAPPAPFPDAGIDQTPDQIHCPRGTTQP